MKKILLFASAALLFAGCAKENITPIENPDNTQKGDITLSFSASQTGFGTKAVIGATTGEGTSKFTAINWQSTDQISVFDGANENCQFSTKNFSTETTTSCTFEGNVTKLATDYVAVYPYTASATISGTGVISGVTLPATQTAVEKSFDSSAALMVAKTEEGGRDLAFQNLVGYVKVATDFECKKIEICAATGEKLAGEGTITFTDGTPSFTLSDGAESTITLRPAGEGTLAAGTYYIAVPATTLAKGWSIRLTDTDDIVSTKKGSKDITFKQSTILNLGPISKIEPRYLTFSAESEQTFTMNFKPREAKAFALGEGEYFEYRVGNGVWNQFTETRSGVTFGGAGNDLQLRGISSKGTAVSDYTQWTTISFGNATKVSCSGDIRTLVNYKDYENANTSNSRFCNLFNNCLQLTSAPDLPATELASECYYCMFENCKSLTTAPKLPAKTLAEKCYESMFAFCLSLTTTPAKLPAEALAESCYYGMFCGCSNLKTAPAELLPATTLADECYRDMFCGCESLETAPELPATKLAALCYYGMFCECTALTTAPELPAETLKPYCYFEMFRGCSALSSVTMLATDVSADMCLGNWLNGAGTNVQGAAPTLTLYNEDVYNKILEQNNNGYNYLPEEWKYYNIRYKN